MEIGTKVATCKLQQNHVASFSDSRSTFLSLHNHSHMAQLKTAPPIIVCNNLVNVQLFLFQARTDVIDCELYLPPTLCDKAFLLAHRVLPTKNRRIRAYVKNDK